MRMRRSLLGALLVSLLPSSQVAAQSKDIVGRVEKVRVYPGDLLLHAKLDTGARHCSLHVPRMTKFVKNDSPWVRFTVKDREGQEFTIERKIVRTAKIKQKNRMLEKRPVVMLGICMGRQYREVEVNLVDRTDFIYPILIGRAFMMGHIIVDPELKFTSEPACVGAPMP
jgi:hypothetical protein